MCVGFVGSAPALYFTRPRVPSPSGPLANPNLLPVAVDVRILDTSATWSPVTRALWGLLLSPAITSLRFIQGVGCICQRLTPSYGRVSLCYLEGTGSVHLLMGQRGVPGLAVTTSDAVPVSVWAYVSTPVTHTSTLAPPGAELLCPALSHCFWTDASRGHRLSSEAGRRVTACMQL